MSELWHLERKLHTARVLLWLRQSYVHEPMTPDKPEQSVCKEVLFQDYLKMCRETDAQPLFSRPVLGKMVKRAFQGIETRRRGPRTNVKQHWMGLRPRTERDGPLADDDLPARSPAVENLDDPRSSPTSPPSPSASSTSTSSSTTSTTTSSADSSRHSSRRGANAVRVLRHRPKEEEEEEEPPQDQVSYHYPPELPSHSAPEWARSDDDRFHPFRLCHYSQPRPPQLQPAAPASAPLYGEWALSLPLPARSNPYLPSPLPPKPHWHVNLEEPHHHALRYDLHVPPFARSPSPSPYLISPTPPHSGEDRGSIPSHPLFPTTLPLSDPRWPQERLPEDDARSAHQDMTPIDRSSITQNKTPQSSRIWPAAGMTPSLQPHHTHSTSGSLEAAIVSLPHRPHAPSSSAPSASSRPSRSKPIL